MKNFSLCNKHIVFVSTWPPAQCGIANFCYDLAEGIKKNDANFLYEVLALTPKNKNYPYCSRVSLTIEKENLNAYFNAAKYINSLPKNTVVCLQHQFDIYGGSSGDYILPFLEKIKKPKVCVIHQTVYSPSKTLIPPRQKLTEEIGKRSDKIVLISKTAKKLLVKAGTFPQSKVVVINHGIPEYLLEKETRGKIKLPSRFNNKKIIGAWGILTDRKGYEYLISALPKIRRFVPQARIIIMGRVSSRSVIRSYYRYLKDLIKKLKMEKYVLVKNQYLPPEEIKAFLAAIDVFVTPYSILDHSSSGSLLFAMAAGKAIISTPFFYAQDVLKYNRGILIPFSDRTTLSEAAIYLLDHPQEIAKFGRNAQNYARKLTWENIAKDYIKLFNEL